MPSSKAAQFEWRVFYLLCIVRVVRTLSADGRAPDIACDNGSDVYSLASNIGTVESVSSSDFRTIEGRQEGPDALKQPLRFRPMEESISSAGPALWTGLGSPVAQDNNAFVFHTGGKQVRTDADKLIRQKRKACPLGDPLAVRKLVGLTGGRAERRHFRTSKVARVRSK